MKITHLILACGLAAMGAQAAAQSADYPNRPIRLVIGFAPGGAADTVARSMSEAFGKALGQTVVVENKPGAGSSIAADYVVKAPADGYTVLIASPSSISINPALNPKLTYSGKDLKAVTKITTSPLVLAVSTKTNIKSVQDLIKEAKARPGALNYATSGNGSAPHLGAALFTLLTGTQMTHIPYRGGAPAIQSVMAGDTDLSFGTAPSVLAQVDSGKLRAIAVSTSEKSALVPNLPGMREAGLPDYNLEFWYGVFVPKNTPDDIVKKIYDAAVFAMKQDSVKKVLAREGTEPALSASPEAFSKFLAQDESFWIKLAKDANIVLN
ncbi:MAG: tripartite tricarboxylate transporter substrate binding protein [Burkholderiaceae bacterium]